MAVDFVITGTDLTVVKVMHFLLSSICMQQFPKYDQDKHIIMCGPRKCVHTDTSMLKEGSFTTFLEPFKYCIKWIQTLSNI